MGERKDSANSLTETTETSADANISESTPIIELNKEPDSESCGGAIEPQKSKNQTKKERRRALWKVKKRLKKEAEEKGIEYKDPDLASPFRREKRKAEEEVADHQDIKKAKLETKALKAKRPGFSEERYNETSYFIENSLRKVYPYYFTFTTFTKGRWVGEQIIDVFAKEFRAHPAEEYERCIKSGTLTVNYEKVDTDYRLKHNDLLANIVHRHETPVLSRNIEIIHLDEDFVVLDKPCSLPVSSVRRRGLAEKCLREFLPFYHQLS